MRFALDREAMLEAATGGLGSLGNDTPVGPANPYYNKDLPQRTRDVEKSKALLAEAGYPDGLEVTLFTSTGRPGLEPAAVVAQQNLNEAGFKANIESVEIAKLYKDILRNPEDGRMSHNNWFGRPDHRRNPDAVLHHQGQPGTTPATPIRRSTSSCPRHVRWSTSTIASRSTTAFRRSSTTRVRRPCRISRTTFSAVRKEVKNYKLIPVQYVDLRDTWVEK